MDTRREKKKRKTKNNMEAHHRKGKRILLGHNRKKNIRRKFAPSFINYKKGALDSQLQVIKITSCLSMVGGSLRVMRREEKEEDQKQHGGAPSKRKEDTPGAQ
jgi:hypothetical protein